MTSDIMQTISDNNKSQNLDGIMTMYNQSMIIAEYKDDNIYPIYGTSAFDGYSYDKFVTVVPSFYNELSYKQFEDSGMAAACITEPVLCIFLKVDSYNTFLNSALFLHESVHAYDNLVGIAKTDSQKDFLNSEKRAYEIEFQYIRDVLGEPYSKLITDISSSITDISNFNANDYIKEITEVYNSGYDDCQELFVSTIVNLDVVFNYYNGDEEKILDYLLTELQ